MAGFVWADAVSGAPSYTGKAMRLLASALGLKSTARPLGATSGVTAGTPASVLSVTSSQWTVQPITGWLDVSAASDGATPFTFDSAVNGGVNAADSTNPRIDLLYIRHDDPSESPGPSAAAPVIGYVAGTAAASPTIPATPARSIPLAQINVPKLNNGSPTITLIAPFTVAAGGVLPVSGSAAYPANPYKGQYIDDTSLGLLRWDGTIWRVVGGDTGWQAITLGASYQNVSGGTPAGVRLRNGVVYFKGQIQLKTGSFPASSVVNVWNAGALPATMNPAEGNYRQVAGSNAPSSVRSLLGTDGSLQIVTSATVPAYIDLSALSGYLPAGT